jgi:hypothetical protein
MPKGYTYNLNFTCKDKSIKSYTDLNMKDLIKKIKECYNDEFGLTENDINLNNQIIYNILHPIVNGKKRPVSKLLQNYCNIVSNI